MRDVVAPALRANRQVTAELTALAPGSDPDDALERANAALPVTRAALAKTDVPPVARTALRAQVSYLGVVRDTLQLDTDDGQLDRLGGASARLVVAARAHRPARPAGVRVGRRRQEAEGVGDRRARAGAAPVAPVAAAPAATPTPAPPVATPTPTATPTPIPTPVAAEESAPQLHPRRARLRERLTQRRSRRAAVTLPGA